jgi:hypothetical protein
MAEPVVTIPAATDGRLMLLLDDLLLEGRVTDRPEKLEAWREELHEALTDPDPMTEGLDGGFGLTQ